MDEKRLAEIAAREEAATKGPWTLDIAPNGAFAIEWEDGPWDQSIINARFMVQAREDIPFLLAEVRRLQADVEVLETANAILKQARREAGK